ncbi:BTAD domain-containing putative transcriptional regulator [Lachnospiraceae bacterium KK002]
MRNENSKIQIPNVDKGYTERTADTLLSSLQEHIILLNAGAGYGKTQILANYIHHSPEQSAWYSISDTDNDLMSFIQNFTKSVQNALEDSGEDFMVSVPLPEDIDILMEQLVIWLDTRISFLNVVFDDFQEISNPDIFNLLDILMETMDRKIRLFIVEKRSLPLFFDKYISSGRAVCIGTEELKFTQEEIMLLLGDMGENTRQCASLIYDCTEGWPVGIARIMLQIQRQIKSTTLDILKEICENLEVSDYFMTKVYHMLPYNIQTFLKKTAVLDYMTPAVCNRVADIYNSEGMLRYLANEKLFVQTLGDGCLYRYHSIFQQFLLSQTTLEEQQETLRTAAYFLLKTNEKIQAAEYACRGRADQIVQAVLEVSGDSMLEDRLYATLERWFGFLEAEHCILTSKTRFIYGKYLMALGHTSEAYRQMEQAGTMFQEEGRLRDYKRVLLFQAAAKRKTGELEEADRYMAQAQEDRETCWNETTEAVCTEQLKIKCCLHQLEDAALLLSSWTGQGAQFRKNTFLSAAKQVIPLLNHRTESPFSFPGIRLEHIPEGFLLRNCILAEELKHAYQAADYETAGQTAREILTNSACETIQTAVAWEILAVLSWDAGDYRKAMEQSRSGSTFLNNNHIRNLDFTPKHRQIINEIHSIRRNTSDTRHHIPSRQETDAAPEQKISGKIKIRCLDGFLVFLPGSEGQPLKWRTKKARELFAYLFHLQGGSVSREVLIELLWPEAGKKSAIALFHTTLYSIRQAFSQEGLEELISYEKKKYSLNMQLVDSDLEALTLFFKDETACQKHPERIMELYPGSYMGGSGYLWSYGMAKELEHQYLTVLKSGASGKTLENHPEEALPFFRRILEADPYNEEAVSQLVFCLYKSGRQSEAKQQYDRMQKLYRDDLELDFSRTFREIIGQSAAP